jgi:hypothetical protein
VLRNRTARGFGYGVLATLAMSVIMVVGVTTGFSPMPRPIPEAIAGSIAGGAPKPLVMALAVVLHLGYGGIFGALLARFAPPVTLAKGIGLGIALWVLMGSVVLPLLGWGLFGTAITPKVAVATLLLHLVYGGVLGWSLDRGAAGRTAATAT